MCLYFLVLTIGIILLCSYSFASFYKKEGDKQYIKWVNFSPTYEILDRTAKLDIASHNNQEEIQYHWIELLAYLGCKYGGDLKKFKQKDLDSLVQKLKEGKTMEELTSKMKYYDYYFESYDAILHEFIGYYAVEIPSSDGETHLEKKYGIKVFSPIAKNYSFSHYDDFGASRSYGYKREHLGNDLMGSIGVPIIAVEGGTIEALGWNQYGGWRIRYSK